MRPSSTQRQPSTDSNDERTCETFGYFALTNLLITDESDERRMETRLSEQSYLLTVSTIVIGALVTLISYLVYKRTHTKTLRQQSSMTDIGTDYSNQQTTASSSTMILESQSSEILVTPPFQSRSTIRQTCEEILHRFFSLDTILNMNMFDFWVVVDSVLFSKRLINWMNVVLQ